MRPETGLYKRVWRDVFVSFYRLWREIDKRRPRRSDGFAAFVVCCGRGFAVVACRCSVRSGGHPCRFLKKAARISSERAASRDFFDGRRDESILSESGHKKRHPVGCLFENTARRSYLPCQCGARFSTKAAGPSIPSAVFSRKRYAASL